MTYEALYEQIVAKRSYLCVGLDPDLSRIPDQLKDQPDPIFAFNKAIIDATNDLCVAYKPNLAFYEALGSSGWEVLKKTIDYIPSTHFIIADAKRGDIGNTSKRYAHAFFEDLGADALTISPYMGSDSVTPFLEYEGKWVVSLVLTSNKGSKDFQQQIVNEKPLWQVVLKQLINWSTPNQMMFVIGATHPDQFKEVRTIAPDHFLLVPGVGAQGGDLEKISAFGFNKSVGLLVNSSRGIIYAGSGADFAEKSRAAARSLQNQMSELLERHGF